jgi:hypothetical protein
MNMRMKLALIVVLAGSPTLVHAGPLPCGWGGDEVGYVCGGEGEDPNGTVPYECPGGLLEGDVCGDITYFGCCDDLGDNWWCDEGQLVHDACAKGMTTSNDDAAETADEAGTVTDTADGGSTDPSTASGDGATDPTTDTADGGSTDPDTASGDDGATTAEPTSGEDSGPSTAGDETGEGGGEAGDSGASTTPSTTANDGDGSSGEGDTGSGDDDKGGCSIDRQSQGAPLGLALALALGLRRRRR